MDEKDITSNNNGDGGRTTSTNKHHRRHSSTGSSKHRHHSKKKHRREGSRHHHKKHHSRKKDDSLIQSPASYEVIDPHATQSADYHHQSRSRSHREDEFSNKDDEFRHGPELVPDPQVVPSSHHDKESRISHSGGPEVTSLATPSRNSNKKNHNRPTRHEADSGLIHPPTPMHTNERIAKHHSKGEEPELFPDEQLRHSHRPASYDTSFKKKDPQILSSQRGSLVDLPESQPAAFRPRPPQTTRYPGAFREGGDPYDYDVETAAFPNDAVAASTGVMSSIDAEVSGMPVANPISAELATISCMKDWWSKRRNRYILCICLLVVIGGFAGLVAALITKESDTTNTVAVAVPDCVGMTALAWGEPHVTTFDNLQYDCQAAGEFVLVRSLNEPFEIQGRFEALDYDNRVSKITAIAISENPGTPLVQVSLPETASENTDKVDVCLVDLLVDGNHKNVLQGYADDNVKITVTGNHINVLYPASKTTVTANVMSSSAFDCFLNAFVCLPESSPSLFNTVGLMGTANGDLLDDWMDPTGSTITLPPSQDGLLYEPVYEYCTSNWRPTLYFRTMAPTISIATRTVTRLIQDPSTSTRRRRN